MRSAFVRALCDTARKNDKIMLLTGDLGYRVLEPFAEEFPDRFINMGVAEQNLVTVAAGLAASGMVPVVYSIATFMTMRPFEQLRNDVGLQNANVKVVGTGAGFAYSKAGPTHHALEDIALMRSIPSMRIFIPGDTMQMSQAVHAMLSLEGPVYLRIERDPETVPGMALPAFRDGRGFRLTKGKGVAIIFTGTHLALAKKVADRVGKNSVKPTLCILPTVAPLDVTLLKRLAVDHPVFAVIEEHNTAGGLADAVAEAVSEFPVLPRVLRFGTAKSGLSTGGYRELMDASGLNERWISLRITRYVRT